MDVGSKGVDLLHRASKGDLARHFNGLHLTSVGIQKFVDELGSDTSSLSDGLIQEK